MRGGGQTKQKTQEGMSAAREKTEEYGQKTKQVGPEASQHAQNE